jgi:hypothetical protein
MDDEIKAASIEFAMKEEGSRPAQGSLKRSDASAHRLLSRSGQYDGVGPVRRQSIASPNAVSPSRSPNLGWGLYHRLDMELIADAEKTDFHTPLGDRAACASANVARAFPQQKDLTAE